MMVAEVSLWTRRTGVNFSPAWAWSSVSRREGFNVQSVCAKPCRGLSSFSRGYNVTGGRCARDRNERDKRKAKKSRVNLLCAEAEPAFSHFYKLNPCPWPQSNPSRDNCHDHRNWISRLGSIRSLVIRIWKKPISNNNLYSTIIASIRNICFFPIDQGKLLVAKLSFIESVASTTLQL